jgi:hypothetical protein
MSVLTTGYEHILLNEEGIPVVAGANMKVVDLVAEARANGCSHEELHFQHPYFYLSMGQTHSALVCYWDHRNQIDEDLARCLEKVDRLRQPSGPPPLVS